MKIWWMIVMGVVFLGNSALVEAQRDDDLEKTIQTLTAECGPYRGSLDQRDHSRFHCAQAYQLECLNKKQDLRRELQDVCNIIRTMGGNCPHCP